MVHFLKKLSELSLFFYKLWKNEQNELILYSFRKRRALSYMLTFWVLRCIRVLDQNACVPDRGKRALEITKYFLQSLFETFTLINETLQKELYFSHSKCSL